MRSINHRKHPARSYRNDFDFASFGDSSASVLLTRNAARFDGQFSGTGQIAPAENILSGRAVAAARTGCMHNKQASGTHSASFSEADSKDMANQPVFIYRATLFDSVMDFLDRHDQMAANRQSAQNATPRET